MSTHTSPVVAPTTPHVVIVGAGFAGLNAARQLRRQARRRPLRITLVDRHNFHTFQPLLYQVASAGLQPQDIGHSVRAAVRTGWRRHAPVSVRLGTVTGVDWEARELRFADGGALGFDQLVLAVGAVTADYGVPGVKEHAVPLKTLPDALRLRNQLLQRFEAADADLARIDDGELTFVIAGGGPTGVEIAGAIAELVRHVVARDHPDLPLERVRIVLVEAQQDLLPTYRPRLRRYTRRVLEERGIEVRTGTTIEQVGPATARLSGGEVVRTRTVIWTAGVRAHPLGAALGLPTGPGARVVVDPTLQVPGRPGVWVAGDLAAATDGSGRLLPQLAPVAIQQGRYVARAILVALEGRRPHPFRYRDKGTMATIGRHDAVVELPFGLRFGGPLAWVAWLFLHLLYLVGFRNRIYVFLSWAWNYLTYDRAARLVIDVDEPRDEEVVEGLRPVVG